MHSNDSPRILIVAAEASSCLYAQRLLQYWKSHNMQVEAFGIGNQAMEQEGFECLGRAEDLAVVGFQEVMAHWSVIKKAFYDLLTAVKERRPHVVLLLDYPGFNLRLAKKLKALDVPVVYYISPQVWAWHTSRIKIIQKFISKMLVVFPFEVDFYSRHGVEVEFVGHPLLDELDRSSFDPQARAIHRARYGVLPEDVLLALMPGSRRSEIKHHMAAQVQTARELRAKHPQLKVALLVAPSFTVEQAQEWLTDVDFPIMLVRDEPFRMIDLADVVLCASGTATLMVGLLEKPMVIMYKMSRFTAFLAKRFVKSTKYFGLINLVLDKPAVPELFQEQAEPDNLVKRLDELIGSESARSEMAAELREAKDRLGSRGATERVAQALSRYWTQNA